MEIIPHLTVSIDEENGLVLELNGSELFDYVEEYLMDNSPELYAAIDDVEMTPDFSKTRIYFSDETSHETLARGLAGINQAKLEELFRSSQ